MTTRIVRIATATAALVGLIATGCSSPAANDTDADAKVPLITSGAATTTTTTTPTTPVVSTTVTSPAPAPAPAPVPTPAPTPAPEPTLGEPPVSVVPPFVILTPIDFSLFVPRVTELSGTTSLNCFEALFSGFATSVSWTAINTSAVDISIDGSVVGAGLPATGSTFVPLSCGDTQTVVVTALWPDGSHGLSSTITITVDPF